MSRSFKVGDVLIAEDYGDSKYIIVDKAPATYPCAPGEASFALKNLQTSRILHARFSETEMKAYGLRLVHERPEWEI